MITMPACPRIEEAVPRAIGYFEDQVPVLGGPMGRVLRLGDRWAIDVTTANAAYAEHGMVYLSRLVRGRKEMVELAFPEPGVPDLDYGSPVVAAAAAGTALPVSGLRPGAVIREGKFFSMLFGGKGYLYQVAAEVTVGGAGTAQLAIEPMLRRQPPAGTALEMKPKIRGFVDGSEQQWQTSRSKYLPFRFSLVEPE